MGHINGRAHDRLSRVGFGWFDVLLGLQAGRIVLAAAATEEKADLLDDFVSILSSFCCSLVRAAVCATQDQGARRSQVGRCCRGRIGDGLRRR